ncbi:hypothetical protein D3C74_150680 [compost metagenome]
MESISFNNLSNSICDLDRSSSGAGCLAFRLKHPQQFVLTKHHLGRFMLPG